MSFNKKYLGSLDDVKNLFERLGEDEFVKIFKKADALIGKSEAIEFIDSIMKNYHAKNENQ
jgi:cell fate (sporulation/competence/biofilm development) regulator YmcA (YheA/YmcA/DUF963 family)